MGTNSPWSGTLIRLAFVIALIVALNIGVSQGIELLGLQFYPSHLQLIEWAIIIGFIAYTCLMIIPFLPGIEIGLALMMLLGPAGVVLVYLCTLFAMSVGFVIGNYMPATWLASLLEWLRLSKAAALLLAFDATPPAQRLDFIAQNASNRAISALARRRFLVLVALINLPGNALIGGAGGIALLAGLSRVYSFPKYLALISIATLPGPIAIMLSNSFK
jgi:hypothetical protein